MAVKKMYNFAQQKILHIMFNIQIQKVFISRHSINDKIMTV
jgi:hypothetical protein